MNTIFENPLTYHLAIAIAIVLVSAILGRVFKMLLTTVFKRLFEKTDTTLDDRILNVLRGRITILSVLAGCYLGVREVRKALIAEDISSHQVLDYINIVLFLILVMVLTRLASRIIETIFEWYMDDVAKKTNTDIKSTVAPLTTKILNIVLFLIAVIIVLDHFGINIGSLLLSLGVGSLAIALAAQETVANMIAGFVILVDQPFRIGDRIRLTTGEEGDVQEIGLRSTRLLNYDNNLLIIPNSELVKSRIINFSFPDDSIRILIEVTVAYGTDVDRTRTILLDLAHAHTGISKTPIPEVFVINLAESGISLRLVARTENYNYKFGIEADLREKIYRTFSQQNIEIPYPHRVIQVMNTHESQADKKN